MQAMLEGSLGVSGPCKCQLSCLTWSKLAYDHSVKLVCCSIFIPLLTLYEFLDFVLHAHPPFYSPTLLLPVNNSWSIYLGCLNHYIGIWQTLQRSSTVLKYHYRQRVVHGHPKCRMMQLTMTPRLHSCKLVDLISSFLLSTLQFISSWPVIYLLHQIYFAAGQDS